MFYYLCAVLKTVSFISLLYILKTKTLMRKLLLLLTAAIAAMSLCAAPVDQATASKIAKKYLADEIYAGKIMAPAALQPVLLKAELGNVKLSQPVYYIFNTSSTFVVIAGDDRAEAVLMVGDEPLKDINNLPPSMKSLLGQYKDEIMFLQEHPGLVVQPIVGPQHTPSLRGSDSGGTYLLDAKWDQEAPYYNQCVFTYSNRSYQCLTGCPATSAAMVFYYHKYPIGETGVVAGYRMTLNGSYYVNVAALPSVTFDWANMKNTYSTSASGASATAVATLMRYVGQAEHMDYGTASYGSGVESDSVSLIRDAFIRFGYDPTTVRFVKKTSSYYSSTQLYTDAQWAAMIQEEIAASRPIVFCAISSQGGHAFNVDGYNSSTNKYHCNFGWSGSGNGWCALNAFASTAGYTSGTFNQYQQMVIGIQPPDGTVPELTVTPTSLEFTANTGETLTKTFTVTGSNLRGDVTISKSGSSYYTVSPATLTKAQAEAGATVTVTYNPTVSGTHTGTITVASSYAESQTVTLSGTASRVPTLTVEPASLTMSTNVGAPVTQTFVVTGTNLSDNVILSLEGTDYDYFSIDKMSILKSAVTSGVTITVTYNPDDVGTHTARVAISSNGAETKYVNLTGVAQEPERMITVTPSSLSFTTVAGQSTSQTFRLTGTNLTGSLRLTLNDNNGCYSISPTTVTASRAANGVNITVTYAPTQAGTHNATVTISGGDAESKTVTLTGVAEGPTITATPASLTFAANTGETVTKTFTVNGSNLSGGNLSLALNDANGVYSITPETITAANAANGVPVTVTYAPTAFGDHQATVTISGGGAAAVTVNLNGTATLAKFTPVMLAAVEDYINLTKFRADWTDATPDENVISYTLEVAAKATEPEPVAGGVADFTGIEAVTNENNQLPNVASTASQYLPDGWTAENLLYINQGFIISGASTGWWSSTYGALVSPVLDLTGYDKVTVVAKVKSYYPSNYGQAQIRILTGSASKDYTLGNSDDDDYQTVVAVLNCSASDQVKIQGRANYFALEDVKIYAGDITEANMLKAMESGDEAYRLITGITDKFYTVENLTAEGTFLYKVKAQYADGTESEWSNLEEVTLFQNGHGYVIGDVDHNNKVDVADVTALMDYVLDSNSPVCLVCADVDGNGTVNVADVTALVDRVLGVVNLNMKRPFYLLAE